MEVRAVLHGHAVGVRGVGGCRELAARWQEGRVRHGPDPGVVVRGAGR